MKSARRMVKPTDNSVRRKALRREGRAGLARLRLAVFLALSLGGSSLEPCTLISVENNGVFLMGYNEDAPPDYWTKVWFREPEEGRFGYMCFGFADGFAQGGMNDQGLAVAWAAGYASDWKASPNKLNYPGNLSQKILTECHTVDEAISVYERYNQPDLNYARTMLADRTGRSVIVSWEGGKIKVVPRRDRFQALGFGEPIVERRMRKEIPMTVDGLMAVMTKSMQKGEATTLFSVVYDLWKGEATVFNIWKRPANVFERILGSQRLRARVVLNLQRELKKGNHTYDLHFLPVQLGQPPRLNGSTWQAVKVDPTELAHYEGRFRAGMGIIAAIRVGESGLLLEWPLNETVKTIALRPFAEARFFAEYRDLQVEFLTGESGRIESALFRWRERDGRVREELGIRIPESNFLFCLYPLLFKGRTR